MHHQFETIVDLKEVYDRCRWEYADAVEYAADEDDVFTTDFTMLHFYHLLYLIFDKISYDKLFDLYTRRLCRDESVIEKFLDVVIEDVDCVIKDVEQCLAYYYEDGYRRVNLVFAPISIEQSDIVIVTANHMTESLKLKEFFKNGMGKYRFPY